MSSKAKLVAPVTGTVTVDGRPAKGIMVQFVPDTQDPSMIAVTSQALTDDAGRFELVTTNNEPGAVPGLHRVVLADSLEERPAQGQPMKRPPRLHSKYVTEGISVTVVEGEEINIEATGPG